MSLETGLGMARERATDTAALVRAAAHTFHRKGYHNATIDDIAEAAGISRPTVYKYTKSKQDLLDSMVDHITSTLGNSLAEAIGSQGHAAERFRRVVDVHIASTLENAVFYAILFSEEIETSETAQTRFRQWAHSVTTDFEKLVAECLEEAGLKEQIDSRVSANLILSMLTTLYRWYDPKKSVSPAGLAEQVLRLLHPALAPALVKD